MAGLRLLAPRTATSYRRRLAANLFRTAAAAARAWPVVSWTAVKTESVEESCWSTLDLTVEVRLCF
jgi:hypothetical protein